MKSKNAIKGLETVKVNRKYVYQITILIFTILVLQGLSTLRDGSKDNHDNLIDNKHFVSDSNINLFADDVQAKKLAMVSVNADSDPIEINGNDEFLEKAEEFDWTGNGSASDPYFISGLSFSRTSLLLPTSMLSIESVTYNFVVENNLFDENDNDWSSELYNGDLPPAVSLINVPNAMFRNNIILNTSTFRLISNNTHVESNWFDCYSVNRGCDWDASPHYRIFGNGITFSNNYFSGVHYSIRLNINNSNLINNYALQPFSNDLTNSNYGHLGLIVSGNNNYIAGNTLSAIHEGISVWGSNNIIYNNSISGGLEGAFGFDSFNEGIEISGQNSVIIGNTIHDSRSYGVQAYSPSLGSIVIYNNFFNNSYDHDFGDVRQGFSVEGVSFNMNYWDDHSLADSDEDGFADIPYSLTTDRNSLISEDTDPSPLTEPISPDDSRIIEILNEHITYNQSMDKLIINEDLFPDNENHDQKQENLVFFDNQSPGMLIVGVFFGLSVMGTMGYFIYQIQTARRISSLAINVVTKNTITQIFNGNTTGYLTLVSSIQKGKAKYTSGTPIPDAIFDFKFLLHPVRLALMKILVENPIPTASELKLRLNLSWGEFTNHLNALEKKGLISLKNQFIDGMTKRVVQIESEGISQYEKLIETLQEYLNSQPVENSLHYMDRS
ncbi:MAG: hypothetical protein HeimC2_39080 [Candidatus Heimdallarchaeota archaeon LC_2]|nr:MAG: hypothetical protein HeimC2_39080 [Candidatus Heimdallarchaeota archaeon LC_2]